MVENNQSPGEEHDVRQREEDNCGEELERGDQDSDVKWNFRGDKIDQNSRL